MTVWDDTGTQDCVLIEERKKKQQQQQQQNKKAFQQLLDV